MFLLVGKLFVIEGEGDWKGRRERLEGEERETGGGGEGDWRGRRERLEGEERETGGGGERDWRGRRGRLEGEDRETGGGGEGDWRGRRENGKNLYVGGRRGRKGREKTGRERLEKGGGMRGHTEGTTVAVGSFVKTETAVLVA